MAAPILSYEDLGLIQGEGWLFRGLDLYIGAARPAGADRPQRRRQDDAAQMPRRPDRHRRGQADDRPGHAGRAARAGPEDGRLSRRSRTGCCTAPTRPQAHEAAAIADQLGIDLSRAGRDRERRRAAAGGDRPRAGAGARRAAARRADQPSRPRRDRMARGLAEALHGRVHRHQPRPHLPDAADAAAACGSTAASCAAPKSASAASRRGPSASMTRKRARPRSSTPS